MTDQHPISPPPEFVKQCMSEFNGSLTWPGELALHTAARAAQWGYDQRSKVNEAKLQQARDEELEECCEWLDRIAYRQSLHIRGSHLRDARRPKPPSLKKQALAVLDPSNTYGSITQEEEYRISVAKAEIILRALEALPDD